MDYLSLTYATNKSTIKSYIIYTTFDKRDQPRGLEFLTTNHEVPCSIPGSTMCVFP